MSATIIDPEYNWKQAASQEKLHQLTHTSMTPFAQLGNSQMEKEALAKAIGAGARGIGRFAKNLGSPNVFGMRASNPGVYRGIAGNLAGAIRSGNMSNGYHSVGGQLGKLVKNLKADGKSLLTNLRGGMQPGGIPTISMKPPQTIPLKASPEQLAATSKRLAENPGVGYMGAPLTSAGDAATALPRRLPPSDPYRYLPQTRKLHEKAVGTARGSNERSALASGIRQHRASTRAPGSLAGL